MAFTGDIIAVEGQPVVEMFYDIASVNKSKAQ
jgi:hypothetical protein